MFTLLPATQWPITATTTRTPTSAIPVKRLMSGRASRQIADHNLPAGLQAQLVMVSLGMKTFRPTSAEEASMRGRIERCNVRNVRLPSLLAGEVIAYSKC